MRARQLQVDRVRVARAGEVRMRPLIPPLLSITCSLLLGPPALAQVLEGAAVHAAPQYYLMSLPSAPVGEIAEAVLGEALGLPYKVDADVDAEMRFEVAGVYAPEALAREFGYKLWNVDVALIEKPSGALWLIPESELAEAHAQGATIVAPLASAAASGRAQTPPILPLAKTPTKAPPPGDWSWLGWLFAGWIGGGATLLGYQALLRRRTSAATPRLAPPARKADEIVSDDLIIPVFVPQSTATTQPTAPRARS